MKGTTRTLGHRLALRLMLAVLCAAAGVATDSGDFLVPRNAFAALVLVLAAAGISVTSFQQFVRDRRERPRS